MTNTPTRDIYNQDRTWFFSFLARTTQKDRTAEMLEEGLRTFAPTIVSANARGRQINIWDIGAGMGTEYLPFLRRFEGIAEHPWNLPPEAYRSYDRNYECPSTASLPLQRSHTYITEPNPGVLIPFALDYLMAGLDFKMLHHQGNGDGIPAWDRPEQPDLVVASHVFYYLEDWRRVIANIYDAMPPGGAACLILSSENGNLHKFRQHFFRILDSKYEKQEPECAEQLEHLLEKMNIPFTSTAYHSDLWLKPEIISLYHRREDFSLENLYSFFLRADYRRLSHALKREVKHVIAQLAGPAPDQFVLTDKAVWLYKEGDIERKKADARDATPVLLRDLKRFIQPSVDTVIEEDLGFLPSSVRQAYMLIRLMDCVLQHAGVAMAAMWRGNTLIDSISDDEAYCKYNFPPGLDPEEVILLDPRYYGMIMKNYPSGRIPPDDMLSSESDHYNYLRGFIRGCHAQFPPELQSLLSEKELDRLICNLYHAYGHSAFLTQCGRAELDRGVRGALVDLGEQSPFRPQAKNALITSIYDQLEFRAKVPLPFPIRDRNTFETSRRLERLL
jgi:SAM-dependent methyltransferase